MTSLADAGTIWRMSKGVFVVVLGVVGVIALLAWFFGSVLESGSTQAAPPPSQHSSEVIDLLRSIDQRLARMESRLDGVRPAPPPVASEKGSLDSGESSRSPVDSTTLGELLAAVRELRSTILTSNLGSGEKRLTQIVQTKPAPDWQEWQQLYDQFQGRDELIEKSLYLQTRAEILARFGRPTSIWNNGNWAYDRETSKGLVRYVEVRFMDGLVTGLDISLAGE